MSTKCMFKTLTVGSWNIEGIYEKVNGVKLCKLNDPLFQKTLLKFDIMCLQETHVPVDEKLPSFKGFDSIPHCRGISSNNRYFGGFLIFIRKSIKMGLKIGKIRDDDAFEITLKKSFFGTSKDKKILFVYASPLNSCYTKSRTENIFDKIETKLVDGGSNHIIMGDLNGKTKFGEDFVRDNSDDHSPINIPFYNKDMYINRQNSDTHPIDQQGKRILELCKNISVRILNGRNHGDIEGKLTRFPSNMNENPSVIDYALCSIGIMDDVTYFSVLPFTGLSDHCCIALNLRINTNLDGKSGDPPETIFDSVHPLTYKYTYDSSRKGIFKQNLLNDNNVVIMASSLAEKEFDRGDIDNCISKLNHILITSAKKSFPFKKFSNNKSRNNSRTKKWYTKECKSRRTALRQCSRNLSKEPFNRNNLNLFVKARSAYKKTCRNSEKEYRKSLTRQLMEVEKKDPKTFWDIINNMNNWGKDKIDPADKISPKRWVEHFKNLLNNTNKGDINALEVGNSFEAVLDSRITTNEIQEALCELKTGKAPGPDGILVEYLHVFGELFGDILHNLINKIFSEHIYPSDWTINFLKPIFKKGETDDTGNYRGLAVGSAFAKLFSHILLKRLTRYIEEKKLLSPNQIGFLKGKSTADHIFLIQTLIEKVVKKGKCKLYVAYIDFKKAYDTVNRDLLLQRLKHLGINGIFLKNIESMYEKTMYSIKINKGYLDAIDSNLGLKQGCPLSPMLFNLYIDDIDSIFQENCDPIDFQGMSLSHFLYADDLVIISHSEEGLQKSLDNLHSYSTRKDLYISIEKSKTMIFNPAGKFIMKYFKINDKVLEPVNTFCYLGFDLKASGIVKHAMNTLYDKANKAMRALLTSIARFNIPVRTSIKLFNTFISPIMLYNTENWITLTDKKIQNFCTTSFFKNISDTKADILHRKFLKYILGVSKSCPNLAVYGETGEIPLSLKGFRLLINYWHRVTNLPDTTLAKKALLENITLRTNWIKTVEKLLGCFRLTDRIDNTLLFKRNTTSSIQLKFSEFWHKTIDEETSNRLTFYKSIKSEFKVEEYLKTPIFQHRKAITKIRCSDHPLEVEKGRHLNIPRENRICKICPLREMETEHHFLIRCPFFDRLKIKHGLPHTEQIKNFVNNTEHNKLGQYLTEAFDMRKKQIEVLQQR